MTLIASIITFPQKKKIGKKNVTLDPRHGTLALDMEPSTLDPRQKDRLSGLRFEVFTLERLDHDPELIDLPQSFLLPKTSQSHVWVVCYTAVFSVVGKEHCVTTLKTAV